MKPSELKKDTRKSLRVSSEVLKALEAKKLTVQSAFDEYIDANFDFTARFQPLKMMAKVKNKLIKVKKL